MWQQAGEAAPNPYLLGSNSKHLLVIVHKAPPPTSLHRTLYSFVCVGGCLCLRGKFKSRLSTIRCGEFRPIGRQMRLRSKMCTGVPCTLDPRDLYPCTDFYLSLFFFLFFCKCIARHCKALQFSNAAGCIVMHYNALQYIVMLTNTSNSLQRL